MSDQRRILSANRLGVAIEQKVPRLTFEVFTVEGVETLTSNSFLIPFAFLSGFYPLRFPRDLSNVLIFWWELSSAHLNSTQLTFNGKKIGNQESISVLITCPFSFNHHLFMYWWIIRLNCLDSFLVRQVMGKYSFYQQVPGIPSGNGSIPGSRVGYLDVLEK